MGAVKNLVIELEEAIAKLEEEDYNRQNLKGSTLMRVLKERVLVAVQATSADSLVGDTISRRGYVEVSGSDQVNEQDDVLFGEAFEEIKVEAKSTKRFYLMKEDNIKIIYDGDGPRPAKDNVLPFFKETVNG